MRLEDEKEDGVAAGQYSWHRERRVPETGGVSVHRGWKAAAAEVKAAPASGLRAGGRESVSFCSKSEPQRVLSGSTGREPGPGAHLLCKWVAENQVGVAPLRSGRSPAERKDNDPQQGEGVNEAGGVSLAASSSCAVRRRGTLGPGQADQGATGAESLAQAQSAATWTACQQSLPGDPPSPVRGSTPSCGPALPPQRLRSLLKGSINPGEVSFQPVLLVTPEREGVFEPAP